MSGSLVANAKSLLCNAPLLRGFPRKRRPRAGILAYHCIGHSLCDPYGQVVSSDNFARHLEHLRRYYYVTPMEHLLEQLPHGDYRDGTVAVTFDDGYADTLAIAYPILKTFDTPLTVFITVEPIFEGCGFWWDVLTAYIFQNTITAAVSVPVDASRPLTLSTTNDTERRSTYIRLHAMLKDMTGRQRQSVLDGIRSAAEEGELYLARPLTVAELQQLAALPGVTIGAHTMTHPRLRALSIEEQEWELVTSKRKLEELIRRSITLVAYPFGKSTDVSRITYRLAERIGYQAGFTTIPNPVVAAACRYALPRLTVHDWSEDTFAERLRVLLDRPQL